MTQDFNISLRQDILVEKHRLNDQIILQAPDRSLILKQTTLGIKTAIERLVLGGTTVQELISVVQELDGSYSILKFQCYLHKIMSLGWICYSVMTTKFTLATAIPTSSRYQLYEEKILPDSNYILSRFVYSRRESNQLVIETSLCSVQVILHDWRGAVLFFLLSKPQSFRDLAKLDIDIQIEAVTQFLSLLLSLKMLVEVRSDSTTNEDDSCLAQWDFHDLLFHSRSRKGRHNNPHGGTYRFINRFSPLPVVKPQMSKDIIDLYKPNIESLKLMDIPFTRVLEQRISVRRHSEELITIQQLGEFLYRSARLKKTIETDFCTLSKRAYPSGGALYELELYLVVHNCRDLPPEIYHYQPMEHQLCQLSSDVMLRELLLKDAWQATKKQCLPQVLVIVSARFQRITWKYESIAYSIIMKNVGVLYQTMYLVATAMNLAPCALGTGNSDLFAKAVGLDYYAETSVGEFALGCK